MICQKYIKLLFISVILSHISHVRAGTEESIIFRTKNIVIPLSALPGFPAPDQGLSTVTIKINGAIVNDFARTEATHLSITPPFQDTSQKFSLLITNNDGEVIYQKKYRRPHKGEFFDEVKTGAEMDSALNGVGRFDPVPKQDNFNNTQLDANAQARLFVHAKRGHWTIGLENDWQMVSNRQQTLRPDGSLLDLDRGTAFLKYADDQYALRVNIGDVQVSAINPLVSAGMSSRGANIVFTGLKGRLRISAAQVFGQDIRGLTEGLLSLRRDNFRRSFDIEADVMTSDMISITVNTSFYKARRPSNFGFRTSIVPEGESNLVRGVGAKVKLLKETFILEGEYAWASYDNPSELNDFNTVPGALTAGKDKDNARHIHLTWQGWTGMMAGQDASLNITGDYRRNGALFNAIQAGIQADLDRRELAGNIQFGPLSMQVGHVRLVNNVDDIAGILKTKRNQTEIALQLDLARFKDMDDETQSFGVKSLLPGSVEVSYRRNRETTLNGDIVINNSSLEGSELPDTSETNWTVALTWNWPMGATSLGYSYNFYDSRQIGRETADRRNTVWNASQSLFGEVWEVEGHATWGQDDNLDTSSKSRQNQLDWGGHIDLHFPDFPTLLISYNQGRTRSQDFVFLENSLNRTKRVDISIDFSPYVAIWWPDDLPPQISLNFQYSDGMFLSDFFQEKNRQSSVTINLSKHF